MPLNADQLQDKDNAPGSIHVKDSNRETNGKAIAIHTREIISHGKPGHVCVGCQLDALIASIRQVLLDSDADNEAIAAVLRNLAEDLVELANEIDDPMSVLLSAMGIDPSQVTVVRTPTPAEDLGTDPKSIQASILSFFKKN